MTGHYNRFALKYADKAAAFIDLLKKSTKWEQSTIAQDSFEYLKLMLSTEPILQYPRFDLLYINSTDASSIAVRDSLLQDQEQGLLPLSYASRKLNLAE